MESWSYVFGGGKSFVSEESANRCICAESREGQDYKESVFVDDGVSLGKDRVNSWELNTPCSWRNSMGWSSAEERGKDQDFAEMGCQDLMRKSLPNNHIRDSMSNLLGGQRAFVSIRVPHNAFSGEDESSSVVESNCKESSLIDLKLGSFNSPNIIPNLSSTVPAKRNRASGLSSHTQFCQVQGCGKDLSSCKEYHKRHKVCEVHSKTAKVIVNGIEQRFCQQCSRFHLLSEFEDGKRSCRKRLAGHNERRRKPQTGLHSGRAGRVFQSYAGTRFQGTPFATSSIIYQDILGSGLLHQQKHDTHDLYKNLKVEHSSDYSPQLTLPFTNGHSQPRHLFSTSYHTDKHPPALHDEGITAITRSKNNESSNSYLNDIEGSDFLSRSLFHNTSIGSQVLNVMDSASTFQGISNSGCALSLLSSQSEDSSNYSSLVPNSHHLITPSSNTDYNVTHTSEKIPGVNLKDPTSNASTMFNLSGSISAEDRMEQILRNNCGINGSICGSDYVNTKNLLSCEDGPTIDLLQLSSQLHRVEHQRHFMK